MKIEEQVLSIEQMNHLKDLGLKVEDTALSWVRCNRDRYGNFLEDAKWELKVNPYFFGILQAPEIIPTLTLQEILELLPKKIEINSREYYLFINYQEGEVSYAISDDEMFYTSMFEDIWPNTLQGAYNMLCWVLECRRIKN